MNGSDAHPASMVNKITWPRHVTLDSLISLPILAGWASSPPEKKVADFDARSTTLKYYSQCKQSTPYSPQWLLIQGIACARSTIPLLQPYSLIQRS